MEKNDGAGRFPELPAPAGREVRIQYEVLNDVSRSLAADLQQLEGPEARGSLGNLRSDRALLTGAELGHYPAAEGTSGIDGLAGTCRNAYEQIGLAYQQFIEDYEKIIEILKKSAHEHAEADRASAQTVDRIHKH